MNPTEWAEYGATATAPEPLTLSIDEVGHDERTLAYGYTCQRQSWHAYVHDHELHVIIYDYSKNAAFYIHGERLPLEDLKPDKRVYPDACELAFSQLMRRRDHQLPFTGGVEEESYKPRELNEHGYLANTHLDLY
jgi:hypothetical protein